MENNSSDCHLNTHQITVVAYVGASLGAVSLICTLFALLTIILFQRYQFTTQRVILYLILALAFQSVEETLHFTGEWGYNNDVYCTISAFLDQLTGWMVMMAIFCLTIDLFLKIVLQLFSTKKLEIVYINSIIIVPLVISGIPFIGDTYGQADAWCWISAIKNKTCSEYNILGQVYRFVLWWVPMTALMVMMAVFYVWARIKAHRRLRSYSGKYDPATKHATEMLLVEIRTYQFYPVVYIVMNLVPLTSRLVDAISQSQAFYYLRLVQAIFISIQGAVISLAFALDSQTRAELTNPTRIKGALVRLWCCKKKGQIKEYEVIPDVTARTGETDSLQE